MAVSMAARTAPIRHSTQPGERAWRLNLSRGGCVVSDEGVAHTPDLDEQLMRTACEHHADALWSFCLRLTRGDAGRAEDIAQETLLRAWKHPSVLGREPDGVRAWLFTVARNVAIDSWRARSVRPEDSTDPVDIEQPVSDRTDDLLQQWLVVDALRSLSQDHRAAIVECYYGGQTVAEAAERLGVPAGTVKSRLHYGMRALRLALEERGVTR
jgi:RNA polymerase sigma-70 factor, ECF subfamily